MFRLLLFMMLTSIISSCKKTGDNIEDNTRDLSTKIMAVRSTSGPITNNWEIILNLDDNVKILSGNIIVQHDLWDLSQFKATYKDTFDFTFTNSKSFNFRTNRNANLQGPEIRNVKVLKYIQKDGDYIITIK